MPTFKIDTAATWSVGLLMSSGPKMRYGTQEQDVSQATGERKWEVQAAMTWHTDPGQRPQSELIRVTILGGSDPAAGIPAGTPIEFREMRLGVSSPEVGDRGVRGGRPWYQAAGVQALNGRQPGKGE